MAEMTDTYLGSAGGDEAKLEECVLLLGFHVTVELHGPSLCDVLGIGRAGDRSLSIALTDWRHGYQPNEDPSLIDVLSLDRIGQSRHRFVALVWIPSARPPWLAVLGNEVVVKRGHSPIR